MQNNSRSFFHENAGFIPILVFVLVICGTAILGPYLRSALNVTAIEGQVVTGKSNDLGEAESVLSRMHYLRDPRTGICLACFLRGKGYAPDFCFQVSCDEVKGSLENP